MKRIVTIAIILGITGIVAFRLVSNKKVIDSRNQIKDNSNFRVSVNVAEASRRMSEKNLTMVGTVAANQLIDIKSQVQGKIIGLYVELGDYVKKDQIIAKIDNKLRQLAVGNAERNLENARRNFKRYKNLYEGGGATKAQYDQYKLALENAENTMNQMGKELSNATIRAPFSGYITAKSVEKGDFVNVGAQVAMIIDISQLKVQVNVPERDVYTLKVGDPVTITSNVYPGITYEGKIKFIGYQGDDSHNYPVEIAIVNQKKNPLRSGTYVDISFNRKSQIASLQIPREALVGSIKDAMVYIVDSGQTAHLKKITVGEDNGDFLEVINGLSEGQNVVTSGRINLEDNAKVSIIK